MAQVTSNVARRVRELREAAGRRQEDVAVAARQCGLAWGRSTVAMLESGRYDLKADELLALPLVLHRAGVADIPLKVLLLGDEPTIAISETVSVGWEEFGKFLGAGKRAGLIAWEDTRSPVDIRWAPGGKSAVLPAAHSEADRKAARRLDVDITVLLEGAHQAWGRTLTEERDARVAEAAPPGTSNRTLQALRAHTTRALLAELEPVLKED